MSPDDPFATSPFFFTTRKRESLFVRVLQTWGLRVDSWKPCFARTGSSKFVTLSSLLLRSLSLSVLIIVFVLLFQFKVQFSDEFRLLLIHFMLFHFWSIWSSFFFFLKIVWIFFYINIWFALVLNLAVEKFDQSKLKMFEFVCLFIYFLIYYYYYYFFWRTGPAHPLSELSNGLRP